MLKSNTGFGRRNNGKLRYVSGFSRSMSLYICKGCFNAQSFEALQLSYEKITMPSILNVLQEALKIIP